MSKTFLTLCTIFMVFGSGDSFSKTNIQSRNIYAAAEMQVGSAADLWSQRSPAEKAAYLDGLCEGIQGDPGSNLGAMNCKPSTADYKTNKSRFCGAKWSYSEGAQPGIRHFDTFYRDTEHSDIPAWAVIAAYNDKVCGENTISNNLGKFQKYSKCGRDLMNMGASIAPEARKKQAEYCDTLKWR